MMCTIEKIKESDLQKVWHKKYESDNIPEAQMKLLRFDAIRKLCEVMS